MFVYIINCHGKPLMPCQPRKARVLLKAGKAKVVQMVPFTLQLLYGGSGYKQEVSVGIDAGRSAIGPVDFFIEKSPMAGLPLLCSTRLMLI